MPEIPSLPEAARCPRCGVALRAVEPDRIDCSGCGAAYPVFDGIPWLFRDVAGSRAQWAAKLQRYREEVLRERDAIDEARREAGALPATGDRLERQRAAVEQLGRQVFGLLEPFAFAHSEAGGGLPRDRIPSRQHVTSYLETVFRDWSWGGDEIRETLELAGPRLGEPEGAGHLLVLGGGAGRLAYELALPGRWSSVVQLDLNPLLTRVGAAVSRGDSITLTEIPRLPIGLEHVAVDQTLVRPGGDPGTPLHFLLGDAFAPPFAPESFDALVTPWFVDILPESFRGVARRLGRLLAPGARWISFGPLSFESVPAADRFTPEEMVEALAEAGFRVEESGLHEVGYLHSPHGMARRSEQVFLFHATRGDAVAAPEEFALYPGWMTDASQSVPALPVFESLRNERIFDVEILRCIDGRTSIDGIVRALAERYELEPDRCRNAVNRFFSRLVEDDPASTSS